MKKYNSNEKTEYSAKKNKRGYTILELTIVLALTAIVTTMIVSFSTLVSKYNKGSRADYAFFEDCAALKTKVTQIVSENYKEDTTFTASENKLIIDGKELLLEEGLLKFDEDKLGEFDAIDGIVFDSQGTLIKCTMYYIKDSGAQKEMSFVFALRVGSITESAN